MSISEQDLLVLMNKKCERMEYGGLKHAAEMATSIYGCDWAHKYPVTLEALDIKNKLRILVISNISKDHSNKDVVWQRFRKYALQTTKSKIA